MQHKPTVYTVGDVPNAFMVGEALLARNLTRNQETESSHEGGIPIETRVTISMVPFCVLIQEKWRHCLDPGTCTGIK